MGSNTKIEWVDHSRSPWHGCSHKVLADGTEHPGCQNCYAEAMAPRNPGTLGVWGVDGVRVRSKSFVKALEEWNRLGQKLGRVQSVFPSICDPFEDRPELVPLREEMFAAIDRLPWVRLLLLTKRPENVNHLWLAPNRGPHIRVWLEAYPYGYATEEQCEEGYRPNVWIGTSVSDQKTADELIPPLQECRHLSPVLFLSAEPLLGPIDLDFACARRELSCIDWVIAGGESGPKARPCHPEWARSLRDQCQDADVPFFWKQWGEWFPFRHASDLPGADPNSKVCLVKADGRSFSPYSHAEHAPGQQMARIGKEAAGHLLDGQVWQQFPEAKEVTPCET
jgi:protein gp37